MIYKVFCFSPHQFVTLTSSQCYQRVRLIHEELGYWPESFLSFRNSSKAKNTTQRNKDKAKNSAHDPKKTTHHSRQDI